MYVGRGKGDAYNKGYYITYKYISEYIIIIMWKTIIKIYIRIYQRNTRMEIVMRPVFLLPWIIRDGLPYQHQAILGTVLHNAWDDRL